MINSLSAHLAMRARALTCVVCTTGSTTLAATTAGFTRSAGSFVTDGFEPGMEVVPSGFASSAARIVTAVSASLLSTSAAPTVESASAGRTLLVGLPLLRGWENVTLSPVGGRPYLEEEWVPGTHSLVSFAANGGTAEETGLYILRWFGLMNTGTNAMRRQLNALMALFTPGSTVTAGSDVVRVRSDTAVYAGQLLPQGNGWVVGIVTIPWRAWSVNVVS